MPLSAPPCRSPNKELVLVLISQALNFIFMQAAKEEADKLLKSSGRQAGMGGMTPDVNAAFRGDRACFLQPNQTDYPALRTASDAVLALQIGDYGCLCHLLLMQCFASFY